MTAEGPPDSSHTPCMSVGWSATGSRPRGSRHIYCQRRHTCPGRSRRSILRLRHRTSAAHPHRSGKERPSGPAASQCSMRNESRPKLLGGERRSSASCRISSKEQGCRSRRPGKALTRCGILLRRARSKSIRLPQTRRQPLLDSRKSASSGSILFCELWDAPTARGSAASWYFPPRGSAALGSLEPGAATP